MEIRFLVRQNRKIQIERGALQDPPQGSRRNCFKQEKILMNLLLEHYVLPLQ